MVEGLLLDASATAAPPPPSLMAAQGLPRRRSAVHDGGIALTSDGPGEVLARPNCILSQGPTYGGSAASVYLAPTPIARGTRAQFQFGSVAAAAVNVDKARQSFQARARPGSGIFTAIGAATTAFATAYAAGAPAVTATAAVDSAAAAAPAAAVSVDKVRQGFQARSEVKGEKFNDDAIAVLISGTGGSHEGSQRRVRRLTSALRARGFDVITLGSNAPPAAATDALWRSGAVVTCLNLQPHVFQSSTWP